MAVFLLCCLFSRPRPLFSLVVFFFTHSFVIFGNLYHKVNFVSQSNFIWLGACLLFTFTSGQITNTNEFGGLTDFDYMTQQFAKTPEEKVQVIFYSSLLCLAIVLANAVIIILTEKCLEELEKIANNSANINQDDNMNISEAEDDKNLSHDEKTSEFARKYLKTLFRQPEKMFQVIV
jgi:hypothetical protein